MSNQRNVRNFLINPRFQLRYVLWLFLTGLFLMVWNFTIFFFYIRENYALLVELAPMTPAVREQLQNELVQIVVLLSASSVAFLALMAFLGLVISHKAAGPLYHFKRVFREIRDGKRSSRIRLRAGDEFQDVAQTFNEMMDKIDTK